MRGQRHHQHKARPAQGSRTATGEYFRASQAATVSEHAMDMSHLGILWNDKVKQGPDAWSEISLSRRTQPLTTLPRIQKSSKKVAILLSEHASA